MSRATLHYLPMYASQAHMLAEHLGIAAQEIEVHTFPDGELRVRVSATEPDAIVLASLDHPNDKIIALMFAAQALRDLGAQRIILVAPYLCYMRQDIAFRAGEAVSQKIVGQMLATAYDLIVTVDAHLHRARSLTEVFPGAQSANLSAIPAIAEYFLTSGFDPRTILVGPDSESFAWVAQLGQRLSLSTAIGRKTRLADRRVEIQFDRPELFTGRPTILLDDIVSSGGTLSVCTKLLLDFGVTSVDAVVVHALFDHDAMDVLHLHGVRKIISTNSVPHPTNAIDLTPTLALELKSLIWGIH